MKIAILNLMPNKEVTERQLIRLLGNADVKLISLDTYTPKNTPKEYMEKFYTPFSKVKTQRFDGLIITGAPVEHLAFEEVDYWDELCEIMDWADEMVTSTLHICWGAQARAYHHYRVGKVMMEQKTSGVFSHDVLVESPLLKGFGGTFLAPHSRWSDIDVDALKSCEQLEILGVSPLVGTHIVASKDDKNIFLFGHMEYDTNTLADEYSRDAGKVDIPYNYFPDDDPEKSPVNTWCSYAELLFSNWLNHYC